MNNNIPSSYTFNNITVNLNDTQKALLDSDIQTISKLNAQLISLNNQYPVQEAIINTAKYNLAHCSDDYNKWKAAPATVALQFFQPYVYAGIESTYKTKIQECNNLNNTNWDNARATEASIDSQIAKTKSDIVNATTQYNNDLVAVQNAIKLQIQAQIANSAAATQNASNIAGINQTNPQVLIQQSQDAEALAKAKQDKQIKVVGFVLLTVTVILIGFFVIRKL